MGYTTMDSWVHIFEDRLTEMNTIRGTAERWVELLKQPQSESNLCLVIYRFRNGQKAEKKMELTVNGDSVLGLEKGAVGTINDRANRYIALITKSSVVRFKMEETICIRLYDMLRSALEHSSWRIYENDKPTNQALHLTSHYIALSKLEPLSLHKAWPLGDVCQVSEHERTVSFTVLNAGFKEFVLKTPLNADKFKQGVDSHLRMLSTGRGLNEYTVQPSPPTAKREKLLMHPQIPTSPLPHDPLRSDLYANLRQTAEQSNLLSDLPPASPPPRPKIPLPPYSSTKPPIPRRPMPPPQGPPPASSADNPSRQAARVVSPATPRRVDQRGPQNQDFRRSLSTEGGRDRWDKFLSDFGVQEEIAHIGNHCNYNKPLYDKPSLPTRRVTRSTRASIVPGRPQQKRRQPAEVSSHGKESLNSRSSFSLYSFLFQVWNSQEITADTLGMDLKTWSDFVVYFELLSSDLPGTVNDWRALAERIGISHMDIQVIDNYSRRFNQCASAIVMLFWQQNARILSEEYSREVLLRILGDLEREDLIEVISGG